MREGTMVSILGHPEEIPRTMRTGVEREKAAMAENVARNPISAGVTGPRGLRKFAREQAAGRPLQSC